MSDAVPLERFIRDVPDFPIPGILYRDITPLLSDPGALRVAVELMSEPWRGRGVDLVASMEARGFIFGAGIALSRLQEDADRAWSAWAAGEPAIN